MLKRTLYKRSTIRKTGAPIRRGVDKPNRKPFKTPPCVTRIAVEDVEFDDTAFAVTVFNSGNLPSHRVRINIYRIPVSGDPEDVPLIVATGSTTLGILERKQVSVIK